MTRTFAVVALVLAACQPWYRDHENLARQSRDSRRTDKQLERVEAEHAAGHHAKAAELARALVEDNPEADTSVWLRLSELETAAGRPAEGRAYLTWRLHASTSGSSQAAALRSALISSLAAEDLTAEALDLVEPQTLDAAAGIDALAPSLRELATAVRETRNHPNLALAAVMAWLDTYGEPDHPILRAALESTRVAIWKAATAPRAPRALARLRELGPRGREELARGQATLALALYVQASRLLPSEAFAPYRGEMEHAAAMVGDAEKANPAAYVLAVEGDKALEVQRLGSAIRLYRRALAIAPWWEVARTNLVSLLDVDHVNTRVITNTARSGVDADSDHDGVNDGLDQCPTEPEDKDGFQDADGCPEPDNDGDDLLDAEDKCPGEREDKDGFQDADGCPDPDNDGDGILDAIDKCPGVPEDKDGFEDTDGCPEPDNDHDRLLDAFDKCPNEPETWNGFQDEDGCPDKGIVVRGSKELVVAGPIGFVKGASTLDDKTAATLDVVAGALAGNPDIELLEIQVHTSSLDTGEPGLALSQARAQTIRDYLVSKGVLATRLAAKGFGDAASAVGCDPRLKCRGKCRAACAKNEHATFVIVKP
jgi:outer membrane protein OmpA-like peptidoglycan-associated protein/tetratricopeptide (TPR) repeat protein